VQTSLLDRNAIVTARITGRDRWAEDPRLLRRHSGLDRHERPSAPTSNGSWSRAPVRRRESRVLLNEARGASARRARESPQGPSTKLYIVGLGPRHHERKEIPAGKRGGLVALLRIGVDEKFEMRSAPGPVKRIGGGRKEIS